MQWRQEQARLPLDVFSNEMLLVAFELDRPRDCRGRNPQQFHRRLHQLIMMDGTMAILGKFLEDVTDASLGSDHGVTWNAQPLSERIRRLEANTMDVQGQAIRILPDSNDSLIAIGLVNADSSGRPDTMGMEKHHNLADNFLCFPRLDHPLLTFRTNAIELGEAFRCPLNDVKNRFPKRLDQFFGKVRPNAFHHPRAEILFNAL